MKPPTHRVSQAVLAAICRGEGGPDAIRMLRTAQRSKTILSIHALVTLAQNMKHPRRGLVTDSFQALREVEATAPAAVGETLDYPTVGAWAFRTAGALDGHADAEPERLAAVAAAAIVRANARIHLLLVPQGNNRVPLPSLGVAALPEGSSSAKLRVDSAGPQIVTAGRRVHISRAGRDRWWFGLPTMRAAHNGRRIQLRFDHLDPDLASTTASIADGRTARDWQERIAPGWQILVERHAAVAEELAEAITMLAPLPDPPAGTVSATGRHAFGAIAMSTPADPQSVAVTLAHEVQHAKLSALMDLFRLIEPGATGLHYAPWRSDPRPLVGLLHGVYAHMAIADFWRREMASVEQPFSAQVEFARWRDAVLYTSRRLLATDQLTSLGRRLVSTVLEVTASWSEDVTPAASRLAWRAAELHRSEWEKAHGPIPDA
jgi:HEXXH motif-containing protein